MKLEDLRPKNVTKKSRKRKGRGMSSGLGKTSGRGHRGQNARSGGGVSPGFEGGQLPLHKRLPKRGFHNPFSKEWSTVNIEDLNIFESDSEVTPEKLIKEGLIKKVNHGVKILGDGNLEKKLTVKANKFSKSAVEKIEEAGGKVEVI